MADLRDLIAEAIRNRPSNGIIGAAGVDPGSDPSLLPRPGDPYTPTTREDEDRRTLQQKVYEILTSMDQGLESLVPPGSRDQVRQVGQLAQMLHPAGDIIDARQNFEDAATAAREGDALGAAESAGWGALSGIGLSELSQPLQAILAGVGASTSDLQKLQEARALENKGASEEDLWKSTGWNRGVDNQWRWEIDDSDSLFKLNPDELSGVEPNTKVNLEQLLHHPKLYEAYEDLKYVPVVIEDGPDAAYSAATDTIYLGKDVDSPLAALLHEIQHRVQLIENFESGANLQEASEIAKRDWIDAYKDFTDLLDEYPELEELYDTYMSTKNIELAKKLKAHPRYKDFERLILRIERFKSPSYPREVYYTVAGEVEPRNVENRLGMSPEAKQRTPPRLTEDVPRHLQRRLGNIRHRAKVKPGLL